MGKTLVIGASENPARYSFLAANRLLNYENEIVLFGAKAGSVQGIPIQTEFPSSIDDLETITLYLSPQNQKPYYANILALKPKRIIFNPGTENPELEKMCKEAGIEILEACTLVMLNTGQY